MAGVAILWLRWTSYFKDEGEAARNCREQGALGRIVFGRRPNAHPIQPAKPEFDYRYQIIEREIQKTTHKSVDTRIYGGGVESVSPLLPGRDRKRTLILQQ